jgi:hypothetical protein
MSRELYFEPNEPAYELARALYMVRHKATAKSFDRYSAGLRQMLCEDANTVIKTMEKASGFTVMHESAIDGG